MARACWTPTQSPAPCGQGLPGTRTFVIRQRRLFFASAGSRALATAPTKKKKTSAAKAQAQTSTAASVVSSPLSFSACALPQLPKRDAARAGAAVTVVAFVVYLFTLQPSVPGGDSPELITAAFTLGIAHPPGYPLYTLLAHGFTWLPYGTVAWRVNLMSAVFDAAAAGVLAFAAARFCRHVWAGVVAGGLFAFAPVIWAYAVVAEVFALHHFSMAVLVALAVEFDVQAPQQRRGFVRAAALVFGLSLSNHQTALFLGAPLLSWMLWSTRATSLRLPELVRLGALFLAGFLPYLYLPLAAQRVPVIAWGDASTWEGFWTHLMRKDYGTFQLAGGTEKSHIFEGLRAYAGQVPEQLLFIGVLLAVGGGARAVAERPSSRGDTVVRGHRLPRCLPQPRQSISRPASAGRRGRPLLAATASAVVVVRGRGVRGVAASHRHPLRTWADQARRSRRCHRHRLCPGSAELPRAGPKRQHDGPRFHPHHA